MKEHRKILKVGFTLIEILVVMTIIGILTTISLVNYRTSQIKARDTRRKSDLSQIQKALEMYYNDYGVYPLGGAVGEILGCDAGACNWGEPWIKSEEVYIKTMPYDPRTKYCYDSDGTYYKIYATLENTEDPSFGGPYTCGGDNVYNYGVSSANVGL